MVARPLIIIVGKNAPLAGRSGQRLYHAMPCCMGRQAYDGGFGGLA